MAAEDKREQAGPTHAAETPFGDKYVLVRHLATGGMAELYLARQTGLVGFSKDIVIKRILPRYVEHTKVVRMFIDEARIAASLNHPNIVHIYDIGQQSGTWYIAMEYIEGENLWSVARRGLEAKNFLPLEHAVKIISMVCEGLEYAHTRAGPEGRPLKIVHRDISPSNILLTYEGVAKIVDFGIARAEIQMREERGLVAGKCHYMSPEALRGEKLDHRADIWSTGVVLWEMTLGRRLYKGKADDVVKRVTDEPVPPPTFVRRDYPPALEQIVMRALEKHSDERYESAAQMMQDLEDFLAEANLRTSSLRIGRYLKDLFAQNVSASPEDAARAAEFADAASSGTREDAEEDLDFDRRPSLLAGISTREAAPPPEPEIERVAADAAPSAELAEPPRERRRPSAPPGGQAFAVAPGPSPLPPAGSNAAPGEAEPVIFASRLDENGSARNRTDHPAASADARPAAPAQSPVPAPASPEISARFGSTVEQRGRRIPIFIGISLVIVGLAFLLALCSSRKAHSSSGVDRAHASVIRYAR